MKDSLIAIVEASSAMPYSSFGAQIMPSAIFSSLYEYEAGFNGVFLEAEQWSDEEWLRNWDFIKSLLIRALAEPSYSDLMLRTLLMLIGRICRHSFDSFQSQALRVILVDNLTNHAYEWISRLVDKESGASDVWLVFKTYRRLIVKALEMKVPVPARSFSSIMEVIKLTSSSIEERDLLFVSCEHFEEMLHNVLGAPLALGVHDELFLKELARRTKFCCTHDYLTWLFLSLKTDYEIGLLNDRRSENPLNIEAKAVVLLSDERPLVSFGLQFESGEFAKMVRFVYNGDFMLGTLCYVVNDDGTLTSFVMEKREVQLGSGVAVSVSFDLEGRRDFILNSKFTVTFAQTFYEPYRKVLSVLKRVINQDVPLLSAIICGSISFPKRKKGHSLKPKSSPVSLNPKQQEAVNMCLIDLDMCGIHLIQGPPGTGKTQVALEILNTLLQNISFWDRDDQYQIMIISMRNDTVDKILMSLLDEHKVLRLGGMSNHSDLKTKFNYSALKNYDVFHRKNIELCEKKRVAVLRKMEDLKSLNYRLSQGVIPPSDLVSVLSPDQIAYFNKHRIKNWLFEFEPALVSGVRSKQLSKIVNFQGDETGNQRDLKANDAPGFVSLLALELRIRREMKELKSMTYQSNAFEKIYSLCSAITLYYNIESLLDYCSHNEDDSAPLLDNQSLRLLNRNERWLLYKNWVNTLTAKCSLQIKELIRENQGYETRLDELYQSGKAKIVTDRRIKVIGATTCAAASHRLFLEKIRPRVVIVEEGAEVLEAHIVASLTELTSSLIIIGDQCQKSPQPASTMSHMKISMLERLMNLGRPSVMLEEQYRMRPEISQLVSRISYPSLVDGPNVLKYDHIKGMKHNIFFVDCCGEEEMVNSSFLNIVEAERVIKICNFLLAQGYDHSQITVLSPYNAQVTCIEKMLLEIISNASPSKVGAPIRCCAVDGFQGEENDIIILSFVRSNPQGIIGFLNDVQRLTVALSRAKMGLFMIGNASVLRGSTLEVWQTIFSYLENGGFIGPELPVICPKHDVETDLCRLTEDEFTEFCTMPCYEQLSCGHLCVYPCHALTAAEHGPDYQCPILGKKTCPQGHSFVRACSSMCEVPVVKHLPCGHSTEAACGIEPEKIRCTVQVEKLFSCFHSVFLECFEAKHAVCSAPCDKFVKGCPFNHRCPKTCHEACGEMCFELVDHVLPCGHTVTAPCSQDYRSLECLSVCGKSLLCGHLCQNACLAPCRCSGMALFICPFGHHGVKRCEAPGDDDLCEAICGKARPECGHPCSGYCKDPCSVTPCSEKVFFGLECGHEAFVPCHLTKARDVRRRLSTMCEFPCDVILRCGHACRGTCGDCVSGRFHMPCNRPCGLPLKCGHSCAALCSDLMHVCDNPSCLRLKAADVRKMSSQELSSHSKLRRRTVNFFDVARAINSYTGEKQPTSTAQLPDLIKGEIYPHIKHMLADVILGPLHEKMSRLSLGLLESKEATHFLLKNLFAEYVTVVTNLPTMSIEKLKNLIFKIELTHWINQYLELVPKQEEQRNKILDALSSLTEAWQRQNWAFSWDQIVQISKLTKEWSVPFEARPSIFPFSRQYAVPLTEHTKDWFSPQTFEDVFRLLNGHQF